MHINRILIIDDSPVARILLKKCLGEGFEIFEAGSGEEGIKLFRSMEMDFTFLDLTMPGMGGMEALSVLLKIRPHAKIAVISADRQSSTIKEALDNGACTVLKKPPRQDIIKKTLHSIEIGEDPEVQNYHE